MSEAPERIWMDGLMRRRGTFKISRRMLSETSLEEMSRIMAGVVVWHTEADFYTDTITYKAECADFAEVQEGVIPPEYNLHVICEDGVFSHREFHQK